MYKSHADLTMFLRSSERAGNSSIREDRSKSTSGAIRLAFMAQLQNLFFKFCLAAFANFGNSVPRATYRPFNEVITTSIIEKL